MHFCCSFFIFAEQSFFWYHFSSDWKPSFSIHGTATLLGTNSLPPCFFSIWISSYFSLFLKDMFACFSFEKEVFFQHFHHALPQSSGLYGSWWEICGHMIKCSSVGNVQVSLAAFKSFCIFFLVVWLWWI